MEKYMVMSKHTSKSAWNTKYFEHKEQALSFYQQLDVYTKEVYARTSTGYELTASYTKDAPVTLTLSHEDLERIRACLRYVINDVECQLRQPESLCVNIEAGTRNIQRLKETLDKLEEQ